MSRSRASGPPERAGVAVSVPPTFASAPASAGAPGIGSAARRRVPRRQEGRREGDAEEAKHRAVLPRAHNRACRSRSALVMTETELSAIARAAMMGLRGRPKNG